MIVGDPVTNGCACGLAHFEGARDDVEFEHGRLRYRVLRSQLRSIGP
jgi:hypothetical protein